VSQEPEAGLARLLDQGRCSSGVTLALGVIYTALLDLLERGEGLRSIVDPGSRPPVRRLVRYCSAPGLHVIFRSWLETRTTLEGLTTTAALLKSRQAFPDVVPSNGIAATVASHLRRAALQGRRTPQLPETVE
jgi:hypothetical protein